MSRLVPLRLAVVIAAVAAVTGVKPGKTRPLANSRRPGSLRGGLTGKGALPRAGQPGTEGLAMTTDGPVRAPAGSRRRTPCP